VIIETMRFRLAPDADVDAFLRADRLVQSDFSYHQPGLLRRTTARAGDGDGDGDWIVVDLWRSAADADAVDATWGRDPVTSAFMSFVDHPTVQTERYDTLD
jgi:hypothetical protein